MKTKYLVSLGVIIILIASVLGATSILPEGSKSLLQKLTSARENSTKITS